jgi:hypothetical protein
LNAVARGVAKLAAVRLHRAALALAGAAWLASCQSVPQPAASAPAATSPASSRSLVAEPGATLLAIESATSRIELRLAAAGALAALGHPHVIVAHALTGQVVVPVDITHTRFEVGFAVESLAVDEAADRAAAGGEFAAPIPEAARAGTREHMLGAGQLEAAANPQIRLRARGLRVSRGDAGAGEGELDLVVQLLGRDVPLAVPVRWQRTAQGLAAQGEFTLLQTALGIQPYSIGGGALRVADAMQVRYAISAH